MLKILSMTIDNLGPYAGEQTIDFGNGDGVTLIWGDNGHGKTTLLNLFRYALFGRFQYRHESVDEIIKLVNREGIKRGEYNFKVVLKMMNDDDEIELTRQYSVRKGVQIPSRNDDYEQDLFLKVNGAFVPNKEHELALIMPEEVSRFFLFDGELLQEYEELVKDDTSIGDKIKKSIESILEVPILSNSAIDSHAALEEYRNLQTKAAQSNSQTKKYASQIETENARKEEQAKEKERLKNELDNEINFKAKLEEEGKQNDHVRELISEMNSHERDIGEKEERRDNLLGKLVLASRDAWKYLIEQKISEIHSQLKLDLELLQEKNKSYESASQLFEYMHRIVELHHCDCCDQDVDESHVNALKKKLDENPGKYAGLTEEEKVRMKKIQVRIDQIENLRSGVDINALKIYENELDDILVKIDDSKRRLKEIQDEISRYGKVQDLSEKTKRNLEQLATCIQKITNLKDGIARTEEAIRNSENALATLYEKVKKEGTNDADLLLASKKVEICTSLNKLFEDGIAAYRDKLKKEVEQDATEIFRKISSDREYVGLIINDNYGLSIKHESGTTIPFRSAGYEHIVALSLIGALHKNAPLRGPIIMDSPFGRLDPTHKKRIITALPSMSDQIILLAYTDEIDSQTAREVLGNSLKKEYRLTKHNSFYTEIELQ